MLKIFIIFVIVRLERNVVLDEVKRKIIKDLVEVL